MALFLIKKLIQNCYSILKSDRNRNEGRVARYVRADFCFNSRNIFSNSIKHVFFDLLIPNVKLISICIFYRPPNVNTFLETFFNNLKYIDLLENEVYFLGDFNVNLLLNNEFILKKDQSLDFRNLNFPLVSKYKELCQTFSLKEIAQEPSCVTRNTGCTISQKEVIDADF